MCGEEGRTRLSSDQNRNTGPSLPSTTGLRSPVHCPYEIVGPRHTDWEPPTTNKSSPSNRQSAATTEIKTLRSHPFLVLNRAANRGVQVVFNDEMMALNCCRAIRRYFLHLFEQNIYFIQMRSHIENSMLWKLRSEMFYVNIVNIETSRETFLTSWHRLHGSHSKI